MFNHLGRLGGGEGTVSQYPHYLRAWAGNGKRERILEIFDD